MCKSFQPSERGSAAAPRPLPIKRRLPNRDEGAELREADVRIAVMAQDFYEARLSKLQPLLLDIWVQ